MPTVKDFYDYIDSIAPFSEQLEWDNSGLLAGNPDKDVKTVCVALDIIPETVRSAVQLGADLIISHHPVIFKPIKKVLKGNCVYELVNNDIAAICAHTSLDCAQGGVNDVLADLLELTKAEVLPVGSAQGLVRAGLLENSMSAATLAQITSEALGANVRWVDGGKIIETAAVCGGSGGDLCVDIAEAGIDALITGDASYHDFLNARELGVTLIAAGHFETGACEKTA